MTPTDIAEEIKSFEMFEIWFADYLDATQAQVKDLLNSSVATHFLIVWSIFESQCFGGYVKIDDFEDFAQKTIKLQEFQRTDFAKIGKYFHIRYQNKKLLKNLMHNQQINGMQSILANNFDSLSDYDLLFLLLVVIYRYRNNIFHGNKSVSRWLKFENEIQLCREAMQRLLSLSKKV